MTPFLASLYLSSFVSALNPHLISSSAATSTTAKTLTVFYFFGFKTGPPQPPFTFISCTAAAVAVAVFSSCRVFLVLGRNYPCQKR